MRSVETAAQIPKIAICHRILRHSHPVPAFRGLGPESRWEVYLRLASCNFIHLFSGCIARGHQGDEDDLEGDLEVAGSTIRAKPFDPPEKDGKTG